MLREEDTRDVPREQREVAYARNRPEAERPPIPQVGDRVMYRRVEWATELGDPADPDLVVATITRVQSLDDRNDPNLWQQVRDINGQPLYLEDGSALFSPVPDPWPTVWLSFEVTHRNGQTETRTAQTMEARMRGAAGWLPMDWRQRPVRLPHELVIQPRPAVMPAAAVRQVVHPDLVK